MDKKILRQVVIEQHKLFQEHKDYVPRNLPEEIIKTPKITAITGVRRCGKSMFLYQLSRNYKNVCYLNFEDERLLHFAASDFNHLLEIWYELYGYSITFFFDEIQNIAGWEKFIRRLFQEGNKIFITGSNSKLLSSELASALTGRHLKMELFPFSFTEYLAYCKFLKKQYYTTKEESLLKKHFNAYIEFGGFPEVVKSHIKQELSQIYQDVLIKDLIVRFGIKEKKSFRDLALYLLSNISTLASYNNLQKLLGIKSVTSIKNYINYFEESYLLFSIPKYDYSLRKQIKNLKKIYTIDTGIFNAVSFNFSDNTGKLLENIVFLELKRRGEEIYYYKNKLECDFLVRKGIKIIQAIQVCANLNNFNTREREINGLLEAMNLYQLNKGLILTDEEDEIIKQGKYKIIIQPVRNWLLSIEKEKTLKSSGHL